MITYNEYLELYKIALQRMEKNGLSYHNKNHIFNMLNAKSYLENVLDYRTSKFLDLAILYHDVIFKVGFVDNEDLSKAFFEEQYKAIVEHQSQEELDHVLNLIEMTRVKYHLSNLDGLSLDQKIIMDCDLFGFSRTEIFIDNTLNVMLEYWNSDGFYTYDGLLMSVKSFNSRLIEKGYVFRSPNTEYINQEALENIQKLLDGKFDSVLKNLFYN